MNGDNRIVNIKALQQCYKGMYASSVKEYSSKPFVKRALAFGDFNYAQIN